MRLTELVQTDHPLLDQQDQGTSTSVPPVFSPAMNEDGLVRLKMDMI
jgi:hypothetical protein